MDSWKWVITSTLHQCFKFYQKNIKKVEADSNPFSEVEPHFVDAKFYLKSDNVSEAMPAEIPLIKSEDKSKSMPQIEQSDWYLQLSKG